MTETKSSAGDNAIDEPEEGRAESTGSSVAGGASAFETFERVEDYFADCRTVDAWTARLAQLETTINEVLPLFLSDSCHLWLVLLDVGTQEKERSTDDSRCFNR